MHMKRSLVNLVIAAYLGTLLYGLSCHAMNFKRGSHPGMYFVVWDMFCGWSAYMTRLHIIAEGESGEYYELAPAPWGEIKPFGTLGRRDYDFFGCSWSNIATNVLKHTEHEPITRVFVVEENWPKKYNVPDHIWERWYDEPKDLKQYYHVRAVLDDQGSVLQLNSPWINQQLMLAVTENPRLLQDSRKGRPYFAVHHHGVNASNGASASNGLFGNPQMPRIGSPLGN